MSREKDLLWLTVLESTVEGRLAPLFCAVEGLREHSLSKNRTEKGLRIWAWCYMLVMRLWEAETGTSLRKPWTTNLTQPASSRLIQDSASKMFKKKVDCPEE